MYAITVTGARNFRAREASREAPELGSSTLGGGGNTWPGGRAVGGIKVPPSRKKKTVTTYNTLRSCKAGRPLPKPATELTLQAGLLSSAADARPPHGMHLRPPG